MDTITDFLQANLEAVSKGKNLPCYSRTDNNSPQEDFVKPVIEEEDDGKKKKKKKYLCNNL